MTFEAYAREWLERQNFIKSTRKWTRQGLEIYTFPVIGGKEITEVTEEDIDRIFTQERLFNRKGDFMERTFLNIPFFVNTETGEIEQSFRQSWSPFPPRLVTLSGTVVH